MQYIILIQNILFNNNNKQVDFSYLQIHPIAQKKGLFSPQHIYPNFDEICLVDIYLNPVIVERFIKTRTNSRCVKRFLTVIANNHLFEITQTFCSSFPCIWSSGAKIGLFDKPCYHVTANCVFKLTYRIMVAEVWMIVPIQPKL